MKPNTWYLVLNNSDGRRYLLDIRRFFTVLLVIGSISGFVISLLK